MDQHASLQAAIHEPIALRPYDAAWPLAFDAERARLLAALPLTFVDVQHIGSTAVPGLAAKPIVDLLAGVATMAIARALAAPLRQAGYTTDDAYNAALADRQWFMRWADGRRTHHLHVVVHGGDAWQTHLRFRDALRADPALAERYAALKAQLAQAHPNDREAYTDAKRDFVQAVLAGGDHAQRG